MTGLSPFAAEGIARTLHEQSRKYVAPFWWSTDPFNADTVAHSSSCFFVDIGGVRFGITAHHVVKEFLNDRERNRSTRLVIRNTDVSDWENRFIDGDEGLDVATFRVSDDEFQSISVVALESTPDTWPPAPPQSGKGVFFTGYPGIGRKILDGKRVEFLQTSNGLVAESVGPEEIEIVIDPQHLRMINGQPIQPTTSSLGGYSGAPLLVVSATPFGPLFWLGGVIIRQLPARNEQDVTHVWARRPGCIGSDGKLIRRLSSPSDVGD